MSAPFRQDRSPVEKPGPASRTCRAGMPGKRQVGWPSLLVTFLLATQEKSDSGRAAARPLLLDRRCPSAIAPTLLLAGRAIPPSRTRPKRRACQATQLTTVIGTSLLLTV